MYGYNKVIKKEDILAKVSQEDIFKLFIETEIIYNNKDVKYKAPYRPDNNPNCYFDKILDTIYFVDFADYKKSKNCIVFASRCLKLSYDDTLLYLYDYFNINNSFVEIPIKISNNIGENKIKKESKSIFIIPRNFDNRDVEFWSKYEISKANLVEDRVIPINLYRGINSKGEYFTVRPFDIAYSIENFQDSMKKKIYRPFGNRKEKWFSNCNQDDIGMIEYLPWVGELLVITKSYKDCRVLKNQNLNSIWLQNEGMFPKSSIIKNLCERFEKIIVWFDNDSAGQSAVKIVSKNINSIYPNKAIPLFLPPILLQDKIKDPSDFIASKGKKELNNFLKEKNIIDN